MDMNNLCIPVETTTKSTEILKPITEIAKIMSNEYLKKVELNEYCKIVESDLTKFQSKVQTLVSAKNESTRIKADYKSRNKINITNSKSLRQALNELYKYKAEMKACYIASEKALNLRRIKYNKIISSYDFAWKKALKEYNADLVFVEFLEIQQENTALERQIEKQEKLNICAESEFSQMEENIERAFYKKILEFSKAAIQYKEFLKSHTQIKKDESVNNEKAEGRFEFKLFKADVPPFKKSPLSFEANNYGNIAYNVDVSVFDDIMAPSESLESQNLEDDGYSLIQNDGKQLSDVSKDQEDELEYLNNYQQNSEAKNKELKHLKVISAQISSKEVVPEENESQYFKQQFGAQNENPQQSMLEEKINKPRSTDGKFENSDGDVKKLNSINSESAAAILQTESEDDIQMECEESVSEKSYENRFGNQKETYECQYQKASSASSEDFPNGENQNERAGPSFKAFADEQSSCMKLGREPEKAEFKSFSGFFTMENDRETLTPSIFKLF